MSKVHNKPAVVYWIHYPEHTDPYMDGYVGVTTDTKKRFTKHKRRFKSEFIKGALLEILHECETLNEAAYLESLYRPCRYMGWNNKAGGILPSKFRGEGRKQYIPSSKHKLKGEERTEAQKKASLKHSQRQLGKSPWNKGIKTKVELGGVVYESFEEAAKQTGKALSTIYRWCYEGKVKRVG